MGKIFCMMGKSSCGKDTIYKRILQEGILPLSSIVPYTTRPIRSGETDGVEYFFTDEQMLLDYERAGKVIEVRSYQTVHGVWHYFTVNDGQIHLESQNYLMIVTLEGYIKIRDYFGADAVVPVYIEVEDNIRLRRALDREEHQTEPKYAEMCRRFLADTKDFSEENLLLAGIKKRFFNNNLERTGKEITDYISRMIEGGSYGFKSK